MSTQKRRRLSRDGRHDYEIGYGKPPKHSQFRPGQSGHPAGRRKGVRNLKTDVMRMLRTPVKVKEGGRTRARSTQEAALMVLRDRALRGDARSMAQFLELVLRFNSDAAETGPSQPLLADDQASLAAYVAEHLAATRNSTETATDPSSKPEKRARKKARK